jgi:hypothetical protein
MYIKPLTKTSVEILGYAKRLHYLLSPIQKVMHIDAEYLRLIWSKDAPIISFEQTAESILPPVTFAN